jgi:hypothetical protein
MDYMICRQIAKSDWNCTSGFQSFEKADAYFKQQTLQEPKQATTLVRVIKYLPEVVKEAYLSQLLKPTVICRPV